MWFENEQLAAFNHVIDLNSDKMIPQAFNILNDCYDKHFTILKTMTVLFQKIEIKRITLTSDAIQETEGNRAIYNSFDECLENDIYEQVESLWNLLPTNEQRKTKAVWLWIMLNTENLRRLNDVERTFKSENNSVFEKDAAMIMMKKIALNMKFNSTSILKNFIISENDIQRRHLKYDNHEFNLFKKKRVLIE